MLLTSAPTFAIMTSVDSAFCAGGKKQPAPKQACLPRCFGSVGRAYWLIYITLEASGHNASDFGRMAQLVEHIVHIDGVTGSSPVATTTSSVRNDRGFLFAFHSGICRRSPLPSKVRRQNAYNCNKKSHAERDACGMGFLYLLICPRRNPWREEQQRAAH